MAVDLVLYKVVPSQLSVSLYSNPINYGYIYHKSKREIGVVDQLNAILGAPHCRGSSLGVPCLNVL